MRNKSSSKQEDLLRLRRLYLENAHIGKLAGRFERSFRVVELAANGKSVYLEDRRVRSVKGRHCIDDTIPSQERTKFVVGAQTCQSVAAINDLRTEREYNTRVRAW